MPWIASTRRLCRRPSAWYSASSRRWNGLMSDVMTSAISPVKPSTIKVSFTLYNSRNGMKMTSEQRSRSVKNRLPDRKPRIFSVCCMCFNSTPEGTCSKKSIGRWMRCAKVLTAVEMSILLVAKSSRWPFRYSRIALKTMATMMPAPSTFSVEKLSCTSTLSTTFWKNSGDAKAISVNRKTANAICAKTPFSFRNSGMNHRNPNGCFSSVMLQTRFTRRHSPVNSASYSSFFRKRNCSVGCSFIHAGSTIPIS